MPRISAPTFYVVTTAELNARNRAYPSDALIFNESTKELREGPGMWANCKHLIDAPSAGSGMDIDGVIWSLKSFVRTSDSNGLVILDLETLIPGITQAILASAVPTTADAIHCGASYDALDNFQIIVADNSTLNGIPNQQVLLTIAYRLS